MAALAPLLWSVPSLAYAGDANTNIAAGASFTQAIGLFNIFVGIMLTVALFTY